MRERANKDGSNKRATWPPKAPPAFRTRSPAHHHIPSRRRRPRRPRRGRSLVTTLRRRRSLWSPWFESTFPNMVSQHRQQPSRLFIPPNLNLQQPMSFAENAPLFSPALPTAIQQGMHPQFAFGGQGHPLQTPMQPGFFPPPPGAPGRPSLHRSHPSVMQLAAAGIIPPPGMPMTPLGHQGMPMTPLGQNGFPPQMAPGLAPFAPPFVPRSKRSASMSVGGPPKAVLGGPQRKVSPMPPAAPATPVAPAPAPKQKKVVVNFPRETIPAEGDEPPKRASFARTPLSPSEVAEPAEIRHPETSTIELYPPDSWRYHLPSTVDVFLPGKVRAFCSFLRS